MQLLELVQYCQVIFSATETIYLVISYHLRRNPSSDFTETSSLLLPSLTGQDTQKQPVQNMPWTHLSPCSGTSRQHLHTQPTAEPSLCCSNQSMNLCHPNNSSACLSGKEQNPMTQIKSGDKKYWKHN